jgi:hypothetical protein
VTPPLTPELTPETPNWDIFKQSAGEPNERRKSRQDAKKWMFPTKTCERGNRLSRETEKFYVSGVASR